MPYIWLEDVKKHHKTSAREQEELATATFHWGKIIRRSKVKNVWLDWGTDKTLKEWYVMLSAHYDPCGCRQTWMLKENFRFTMELEICRGTFGCHELQPNTLLPILQRSCFDCAVGTAWGKGLLWVQPISCGKSSYSIWNQIIYNLNIDGHTHFGDTVIGSWQNYCRWFSKWSSFWVWLESRRRSSTEQGLYDRSDIVSLSQKKAIPAPTF